jgi:hypothetical protein
MRSLGIVALAVAVSGCAIQRAQVAQDARIQMVGMSKEQVLTCMGPPASKAAEAQTEVWGYNSGDGTVLPAAPFPVEISPESLQAGSARSTLSLPRAL